MGVTQQKLKVVAENEPSPEALERFRKAWIALAIRIVKEGRYKPSE